MLGESLNFNDFPNALYTLTVVCFGEWVFLLRDLEVQEPLCTHTRDCGNRGAGLYMFTFLLMSSFIMVNMVRMLSAAVD